MGSVLIENPYKIKILFLEGQEASSATEIYQEW